MRANRRSIVLVSVLAAVAAAGCAAGDRPRIARGATCASCSMEIADLRFAAARRVAGRWRAYDAIECLIRDAAARPGGPAWLSDYDGQTLHPQDSMWVVKGEFPSPMGGGFAAFTERAAADDVAAQTRGAVGRLADWPAKDRP